MVDWIRETTLVAGIVSRLAAVFTAAKDVAGMVELYASSDDGSEITKFSGDLVGGGDVFAFDVSMRGIVKVVAENIRRVEKNVRPLYCK